MAVMIEVNEATVLAIIQDNELKEEQIRLLKDQVEKLKEQNSLLADLYNKACDTANDMNRLNESLYIDIKTYVPVISTGLKMREKPGRKTDVSDELLISLYKQGKGTHEIALEVNKADSTVSIRLKGLRERGLIK